MDNEKIISSTLADIYLQQGNEEKALEIYEKLTKREPHIAFYRQRLSSIRKDMNAKQKFPTIKKILKKKLW